MVRKMLWMILGAVALIVVLYQVTMSNLIVDEEPKASDIIIVPEGAITPERASNAERLLNGGYSKTGKVIVSPYDENNRPYYKQAGISENQIINEPDATSTYTNATNTLKMMQDMGLDSAIITTSDYHMLRTKLIYERQNRHYGFDLTYVAAYHEVDGKLVTWHDAPEYIQGFARQEFIKFWAYVFFLYHWVDA